MEDGDILDAFDDAEELTKSIRKGEEGPWNDESAVFEDPKLAQLQKEMTQPQETAYQQRRMQEIQRRAVEAEQKAEAKARKDLEVEPSQTTWTEDGAEATAEDTAQWGEAPTWNEQGTVEEAPADRRSTNSRPDPDSPVVHARRAIDRAPKEKPELAPAPKPEQSLAVRYAPSVFAAVLVFVAATVVHGMLYDWHVDLAVRSVLAMGVTGVLWYRFQTGRLRAMAIGAAVYTAAFVPSGRLGTPDNMFALFLGLLTVAAGSGLVGVQRDEFGGR